MSEKINKTKSTKQKSNHNLKQNPEAISRPMKNNGFSGKKTGECSAQNTVKKKETNGCPYAKKCGGCSYKGEDYNKYLSGKRKAIEKEFATFVKEVPIVGMDKPFHYRCKVNAAFARKRNGEVVSGVYKEGTHEVIDVESCLIENEIADSIIRDVKGMLKSFKIWVYNEDNHSGLLRHIMVRVGKKTGEVMLILVVANPTFPSKNNFAKAIRKLHPEISTIVLNVNDKDTSMVLGQRDIVIYGKGSIRDELLGIKYILSPQSFFQVNPEMTEKIYSKAMEYADIKSSDRVFDAYCGIGTIGLTAAKEGAKEVIGVELNKEAVKDAIANAKLNDIKNARFFQGDAGKFMVSMAENGEKCDVLFMDPPRSGSTSEFISAIKTLAPKKVVYVSCNPETLKRDLFMLGKKGYRVVEMTAFDNFPWTEHVESVVLLTKVHK